MKKLSVAIAAIAAGFMGMSSAQAYEAGDMILRVGAASVNPDDSSSDIKIGGSAVGNTGVGVKDNTQVGITGTYMLTSNIGIELLAATPFKHDITGKGLISSAFGVDNVGSVKHLPPTLSAQYYFADSKSAWQPYVGLGLNYTTFFSEELSGSAKSNLGASDLKLDDSWGLAVEAGFDYSFNSNWMVNVSVWKADIDTTATLNTALGKAEVDVQIDPIVYMVAVGYKF